MNIIVWILVAVISLFLLNVSFVFWRTLRLSDNNKKLEGVLLRVAVSKTNERGPIVAEQIYSALHALDSNYGFLNWFKGEPKPRISLEIASVNNVIQFFIWSPLAYRNVIESQIYAQYPDVEIEEVEDYAKKAFDVFNNPLFSSHLSDKELSTDLSGSRAGILRARAVRSAMRNAVTAELKFSDPDFFPIKRYSQFEDKFTRLATEPLAGVTATLSKLNATDEQAWIQLTMEPIGDWWRVQAMKCLRLLARGMFSSNWMKSFIVKMYLARGFWTKLFYSPFYFWLLFFRKSSTELAAKNAELDEQGSANHDGEDPISAAVDKVTRLSYFVNLRIVYLPRPENRELARVKINEIAGSFRQFNMPNLNSLEIARVDQNNALVVKRFQQRLLVNPMIMSVKEIATLYHMPSKDVGTPNVFWVKSRRLEPPHNLPVVGTLPDDELTIMGESNFRGHRQRFGVKRIDRRRHIYIIGKTGMGKSVLLENMIRSDVYQNRGVAVIDPHGDLAEAVIDFVPSHRTNDVVILDPSDISHPFAFNMLEAAGNDAHKRNLIASGLLGVFKKMYSDSWGPRLEHILRNCLLALAETPNTSMLGIMRLLIDPEYRRKVVSGISNPMVRSFWVDEFGKMQDRQRTEAISPIQNKVGQFLSSSMIRNIVGQVKSTVNIRFMMDTGKIVIVNLSKGKIGEDNSSLLGSMLITKFQLDAMSRADMAEQDRRDFYLYVDEFQNFATDAFATILSEARKYRLNLTMANQYIAQMPDEVRGAVFGNVGTIMNFQVGFDDAEYFSNQFSEEVMPNDIVSLPKYNCYIKLMIDGMPSKTFSVSTLPPPESHPEEGRREKVIRLSRERYCTDREIVEDKIRRWTESGNERKKPKNDKKKEDSKKISSKESAAVQAKGQKVKVRPVSKLKSKPKSELPLKKEGDKPIDSLNNKKKNFPKK